MREPESWSRNSNAAFATIFEIFSFFSSKQKLYIYFSISQGSIELLKPFANVHKVLI
jgi:hypothetical protein